MANDAPPNAAPPSRTARLPQTLLAAPRHPLPPLYLLTPQHTVAQTCNWAVDWYCSLPLGAKSMDIWQFKSLLRLAPQPLRLQNLFPQGCCESTGASKSLLQGYSKATGGSYSLLQGCSKATVASRPVVKAAPKSRTNELGCNALCVGACETRAYYGQRYDGNGQNDGRVAISERFFFCFFCWTVRSSECLQGGDRPECIACLYAGNSPYRVPSWRVA